ncbi:MAG: four helix bundle protein [Pyrinomonadaceae bacterium]
MARINSFEDLDAWKIAREITREVYALARRGDFSRDFGLRDQICRSAVSIMSNIAEGFERDGTREFINFLSIAKGSAGETRSLLIVASDQGYISEAEFRTLADRLTENGRVIAGLSKYLNQSDLKGLKFKSRVD